MDLRGAIQKRAAEEAAVTYRVRVGADGRWHYQGTIWLDANRTALGLFKRTGRAEIFAYRGEKWLGQRTLTEHPDPVHRGLGTPLIKQQGEMF